MEWFHLHHHHDLLPWIKAFPSLKLTDEEKKALYDRYNKDLNKHDSKKDIIEDYLKID